MLQPYIITPESISKARLRFEFSLKLLLFRWLRDKIAELMVDLKKVEFTRSEDTAY